MEKAISCLGASGEVSGVEWNLSAQIRMASMEAGVGEGIIKVSTPEGSKLETKSSCFHRQGG